MPIFEVEKNGEAFEIDAPDFQSAAKALSAYTGGSPAQPEAEEPASVGGFLSNAVQDAGNLAGGLVQAVTSPVETVQAIAGNPSSLVEPFVEMAKDPLGFTYEQPLSALLNVSGGAGLIGLGAKAGRAGKIAAAANKVSRFTDPFLAAAKVADAGFRGSKRAAQSIVGGTSATHQAPRIAAQLGFQSAGQGVRQKLTGKAKDPEPEAFLEQLRDTGDPEAAPKLIEAGEREIRRIGQAEIDAGLNSLPGFDTSILGMKTIQDALQDAFNVASTGSDASRAVFRRALKTVEEWTEPAAYKGAPYPVLTDLARTKVGVMEIRARGLDPATATHHDYLMAWARDHRTGRGIDKLKRRLAEIYPGYKKSNLSGQKDATAAKVGAIVANAAKKTLQNRWGRAYDDVMAPWGRRMNLIQRVRETFGTKDDTVSRRVTAINRDTVFADFGNRAKLLKEFAAESGIPEGMLPAIAAGRSARGFQPRNLMSGGVGAVASGVLLGTPAGVLVAAMHFPRLVGEAAFRLGKAEGLIVKPLKAAERAMNRVISTRAAGQVVGRAGIAANASQQQEQFKNAVAAKAAQLGFKLHPRVVDKLVSQLLSEDTQIYLKGLKSLSANKRLMKLIEELGKGE